MHFCVVQISNNNTPLSQTKRNDIIAINKEKYVAGCRIFIVFAVYESGRYNSLTVLDYMLYPLLSNTIGPVTRFETITQYLLH